MSDLVEHGRRLAAHARELRKRLADAESTIDLLESNARVQAKLLADTGRERDELRKQLAIAYNALKPFASVVEVAPLGDGKIDRVMIEVSIKDLRAAMRVFRSSLAAKKG